MHQIDFLSFFTDIDLYIDTLDAQTPVTLQVLLDAYVQIRNRCLFFFRSFFLLLLINLTKIDFRIHFDILK
jgi:hypothetical protein